MGLASAERQRYAASWADTLRVLREQQPGVLAELTCPFLDVEAAGAPPSTRRRHNLICKLKAPGRPHGPRCGESRAMSRTGRLGCSTL